MYRSNHWQNGRLALDMRSYLRRHDIVYRTPARKGYEGLPIGNGRMGGPVYHTASSLELPIHHTDAIAFAPDGRFACWAWEAEEKNTAPFACGRLRLISPLPLFDWVYLSDFEERLNLADACLTGRGTTAFASYTYKLYASDAPGALVLEFSLTQNESAPLTLRLEKWGTPNFFHHYEQVVRTFDKGLDGTDSGVDGDTAYVRHTHGQVATAMCAAVTGADCQIVRVHAHCCELRFAPAREITFTLHLTAEVAADADAALTAAKDALRAAQADGALLARHAERWQAFWARSFVYIPDDYLENLYYMHLYQLNSCGRGKYPPLFGGLWTWFGDARNWGHFYHWNHQQTCWGLDAAGHPELTQNYLDYRLAMLPQAQEDARALHGAGGAFYSDVSNLNGYNAAEPDTVHNYTCGAQIALDFYRRWRYTGGDGARAQATTMVREALALYASLLEEGDDGLLRLKGGSTCYESYWNLRETLTDHAHIRALLHALEALEGGQDPAYAAMRAKLYPYRTERVVHEGQALEIYAAGQTWDGATVAYDQGAYPLSPFPATLLCTVHPTGLVGLGQRGTPEFAVAQSTAQVLLDREVYTLGALGLSGHAPTPQMAARLGMGEDAWRALRHFAQTYQLFPNGLFHFADVSQNQQWSACDRPRVLEPGVAATRWAELHEKRLGPRSRIDSDWFLHCYFEAAANLLDGIQEALLQSHDGVIRVFPAMERDASAVFSLWAVGGFCVTAELASGQVRYVALHSAQGGACAVESPWPGQAVCRRIGELIVALGDGEILRFDTAAGEDCLLYPADAPLAVSYAEGFGDAVNAAPKRRGRVQIGLYGPYDPVPADERGA